MWSTVGSAIEQVGGGQQECWPDGGSITADLVGGGEPGGRFTMAEISGGQVCWSASAPKL